MAITTERARPSGRALTILGYHKVGRPPAGTWETWFYVPEATFAVHLAYLRDHDWRVIDVVAFLRGLVEPTLLPERAVLLTFDDGYRSMRGDVLAWLSRFDYPAVLFVPTDFVGGRNRFDAADEPDEPICDWDDLRYLDARGVSIQSHGASHQAFSRLDAVEQLAELGRSKAALETGLGKPVEVFAFPYGDGGTDSAAVGDALRRAGYRAGCLYRGGPNPLPIGDPYRLTRLAIGPDTDLAARLEEALGLAAIEPATGSSHDDATWVASIRGGDGR